MRIIAAVSFLVLLQASTAAAQTQNLPVRWEVAVGGNGHLYQAILCPAEIGGISWSQADSATTALGGDWHLATIASAAENAFLYDLVDDDPAFWNCCLSGNSAGPWLGGISSCNACNDWAWVTGEAWSFTNWGTWEPFGNGDVLGFFGYQAAQGAKWNDVPRTWSEYGYIMECPDGGDCPVLASGGCVDSPPTALESTSWGLMKTRY